MKEKPKVRTIHDRWASDDLPKITPPKKKTTKKTTKKK